MTIDDLATLIKGEFNRVDERLDTMESDIADLKKGQKEIRESLSETNRRLAKIEKDVEDIKETVNDTHRMQLLDLQKRVEALEKKAGIAR